MAIFTGTPGVDEANATTGVLTGFTGGSVAELQDTTGDTFILGAGDDIVAAGNGADTASFEGSASKKLIDLSNGTVVGAATVVDLQNGTTSLAAFNAALANEIYLNFHTQSNPGGEIRGQVNGIHSDTTDGSGIRTVVFNVGLITGANEIPMVSTDAIADASLSMSVDASNDVTYSTTVRIEGISTSELTAAHLHLAPEGFEGGVVANILTNGATTVTTVTETDSLSGIENVIGGENDDSIRGDLSDNVLDGGGGIDTAIYDNASGDVSAYLTFEVANGAAGNDVLTNFENLTGGDFNDRLVGNSSDNVLTGGSGNDILKGNGGNDTFFGDDGDDRIVGGAGDDVMHGGAGSDILYALGGDDILNGGDDRDFVYGGRDADTVHGDGGDDEVRGNLGNDLIFGDAGSDDLRGGGNNDTLDGGADDDFLFGENGLDIVFGGAGNDSLTGGYGAGILDNLRDTFVYSDTASGGGGFDRIKDWEDGKDVIDLSSFGFTDFSTEVLTLASNTGGGVRVDFGNSDVLFIENFDVAQFNSSDVLLV